MVAEHSCRARLRQEDMDVARRVHATIHDMPIWLGAEWATLTITHAELPLAPPIRRQEQQLGDC